MAWNSYVCWTLFCRKNKLNYFVQKLLLNIYLPSSGGLSKKYIKRGRFVCVGYRSCSRTGFEAQTRAANSPRQTIQLNDIQPSTKHINARTKVS